MEYLKQTYSVASFLFPELPRTEEVFKRRNSNNLEVPPSYQESEEFEQAKQNDYLKNMKETELKQLLDFREDKLKKELSEILALNNTSYNIEFKKCSTDNAKLLFYIEFLGIINLVTIITIIIKGGKNKASSVK